MSRSKSRVAVEALSEVDPQFAALCEVLFGKAATAADVWSYVYTPDGVSKMLDDVAKANPDQADLNAGRAAKRAGRLMRRAAGPLAASVTGGIIANQLPQTSGKLIPRKKESVDKADDSLEVTWAGEFAKFDEDKHQVFGWASIVSVNGEPVVDRQGDVISPEDIEKAAYQYVLENRKGGHQHKRVGEEPFHASDLIESFVLTPEKISKMGLPEDTPVGWWVGYKVHDDETWSKIKKGDVTGFSIHGRGKRVPIGV